MKLSKHLFLYAALLMGSISQIQATSTSSQPQRTIKVATQPTSAPFSMQGDYEGYSIDGLEVRMMVEVAKRLKATYEPVIVQWEGILPAIINGSTFDFSSTVMDITPERVQEVDFIPWFESGPAIALPKNVHFTRKDQLKGMKVGAIVSSTFAQMAQDWSGQPAIPFKSESDAFLALSQGKVDAIVTDRTMGLYTIAKHHHLNLKMFLDPTFEKITKGWAFSKKQAALRHEVEAALDAMKKDGTYRKIINSILESDK